VAGQRELNLRAYSNPTPGLQLLQSPGFILSRLGWGLDVLQVTWEAGVGVVLAPWRGAGERTRPAGNQAEGGTESCGKVGMRGNSS
jgi:hypothetical protein